MIRKDDIKRAVVTFKEWDNKGLWDRPKEIFRRHTFNKSENSLRTAQYLIEIMQKKGKYDFCDADYNGTLWIINSSYYSIFFLAQYLLALDNKKLPRDTTDSHKMTELAFLYYYIIKESGLEGNKEILWNDINQSRMSKALSLLSNAENEADELMQKAKNSVEIIDCERRKRNNITYAMNTDAEIEKARASINNAVEFRDIVMGYISSRNSSSHSKTFI